MLVGLKTSFFLLGDCSFFRDGASDYAICLPLSHHLPCNSADDASCAFLLTVSRFKSHISSSITNSRRSSTVLSKITPIRCRSMASSSSDPSVNSKPWLLVGLGNPGKKFEGTRHNVGFEMLDAIAEEEGISVSSIRFKAVLGKGLIVGVPVLLAKPQTFMNVSGESVGSLVSYFNIPLNQVLLIYDDMDLPFASLRLLPKGGHGGHKGMRSVIDHFKGSRDFPRLRIGIGRPPGKMDPVNFVLRSFNHQ